MNASTCSLLEIGCGEATTLVGVLQQLRTSPHQALGFDISWSRCVEGLRWQEEKQVRARFFVADFFEIPLDDASVDVVYTAHSIEPNGGREGAAIRELAVSPVVCVRLSTDGPHGLRPC